MPCLMLTYLLSPHRTYLWIHQTSCHCPLPPYKRHPPEKATAIVPELVPPVNPKSTLAPSYLVRLSSASFPLVSHVFCGHRESIEGQFLQYDLQVYVATRWRDQSRSTFFSWSQGILVWWMSSYTAACWLLSLAKRSQVSSLNISFERHQLCLLFPLSFSKSHIHRVGLRWHYFWRSSAWFLTWFSCISMSFWEK